jgi:hypothetical protein
MDEHSDQVHTATCVINVITAPNLSQEQNISTRYSE